jgi:hypothetical protein
MIGACDFSDIIRIANLKNPRLCREQLLAITGNIIKYLSELNATLILNLMNESFTRFISMDVYLKSDFLDFHFPSVGEERQISFFPGSHINLGANHLHLKNNSWLSFTLRIVFFNV